MSIETRDNMIIFLDPCAAPPLNEQKSRQSFISLVASFFAAVPFQDLQKSAKAWSHQLVAGLYKVFFFDG